MVYSLSLQVWQHKYAQSRLKITGFFCDKQVKKTGADVTRQNEAGQKKQPGH